MSTKDAICNDINRHAATSVAMDGEIDDKGIYRGHIEGSSPDELYEFLRYVAVTRGRAFDSVGIRYGRPNPPTFTCYVEFDTSDLIGKEGFLISLCQACGARVQADPKLAGRSGECPKCGNMIIIGFVTKAECPPLPEAVSQDSRSVKPSIDLSKVYFRSSNHKRYNSGVLGDGDNSGCNRAIEIRPDAEYEDSYIVTLYNLDETHPQWGDNVQIAPKRMRVVSSSQEEIALRGYGSDPMLARRPPQIQENYGIVIHLKRRDIEMISYLYHDRNVRIDFLKAESGVDTPVDAFDQLLRQNLQTSRDEVAQFRAAITRIAGRCSLDNSTIIGIIDARRSIGHSDQQILALLIDMNS